MRNLQEFLAKYYHILLFALLEVISLVLLFQYNSYQGSAWFSSANYVSGKAYEYSSKVESYFALSDVNKALMKRNVLLERQLSETSEKLREATSDRTLRPTMAQALGGYKLVPAEVVSNNLSSRDNLLTIDRGSADGVQRDMGVISGTGVVGIVYLVSTHYAVVIPVLNVRSSISCVIKSTGYSGNLHWEGGLRNMAYLDDVPRHAQLKKGDEIVTSGYSLVFPPGVSVGRIRKVQNSPDGLSYRLTIALSTDFGNLRDVYVVDNSGLQERLELMRAAQDSLEVKQ